MDLFSQSQFTYQTTDNLFYIGKAVISQHFSPEVYLQYYRTDTIGEMFDKAVDKTLGNKDFMKFAEDKKG